jgi:hypothetical protein
MKNNLQENFYDSVETFKKANHKYKKKIGNNKLFVKDKKNYILSENINLKGRIITEAEKIFERRRLRFLHQKRKNAELFKLLHPKPFSYIEKFGNVVNPSDLDGHLNDNFTTIFWKRKSLGHPEYLVPGPMIHKQLDIMGYYINKYTGEAEIRSGLNHRVHSSMCAKYVMIPPFKDNVKVIKVKYWDRFIYTFQNTYCKNFYSRYKHYLSDSYEYLNSLRYHYNYQHIIEPFKEIPLAGFRNNLFTSLFITNKNNIIRFLSPNKFY